jgi:hypothetical protein
LDNSGISIAPPMRHRAATATIAPPPLCGISTRTRKKEEDEDETSGDNVDDGQDMGAGGEWGTLDLINDDYAQVVYDDEGGYGVDDGVENDDDDDDDEGGDEEEEQEDDEEEEQEDDEEEEQEDEEEEEEQEEEEDEEQEEQEEEQEEQENEGDVEMLDVQPDHSKRGRECAESGNTRARKAGRHTIAPVTREPSQSPLDENDLRGSSRITGGILRGKATGSHFNWGDNWDVTNNDPAEAQPVPVGKVLLYNSRDEGATPHLSITTQTVSQLPPILKKLSVKFSPIKSQSIV